MARHLQMTGCGPNADVVMEASREQFLHCNLNALKAAFVPELVKQGLIDRLLEAYGIK